MKDIDSTNGCTFFTPPVKVVGNSKPCSHNTKYLDFLPVDAEEKEG